MLRAERHGLGQQCAETGTHPGERAEAQRSVCGGTGHDGDLRIGGLARCDGIDDARFEKRWASGCLADYIEGAEIERVKADGRIRAGTV